MKQRIYLVRRKPPGNTHPFLVRAPSRAAAVHYVAAKLLEADLADQDTLVALVSKGTEVEDAKVDQGDLPLTEDEQQSTGTDG